VVECRQLSREGRRGKGREGRGARGRGRETEKGKRGKGRGTRTPSPPKSLATGLSGTKGKQYRLTYSTVRISELAAFDLLDMLLKHDEKSFYMIN